MATETLLCGIALTLAAGALWYVLGIGPMVLWLMLAAIAAPIIGRAIAADEAFDVDLDEQEK